MSLVSLVVAASTDSLIGRTGGLPWRLSADLKRFKAITIGKPILMGRLTYESIGRPLPGRQNIVISTQEDYSAPGCDVVATPAAAIAAAGTADEIMVIGGGEIYRQFLPLAQRIYLTRVHAELAGDTYFPSLDEQDWRATHCEEHAADADNEYDYTFVTLERI
ncbi:MAG: type 3 dihydrofolate reductase [Woeseiaceae bacterium]|jgi:dihydrofolate reductase